MKWRMRMTEKNVKDTKNEQKRNKFTILLFALLLIGMATYGTYAYYTDSTSIDADLTLTNGTIDLGDASPTGDWVYDEAAVKNNTALDQENTNKQIKKGASSFSNIQPGDAFTRSFDIAYNGSLDATVVANVNQEKLKELENNSAFVVNVFLGDKEITNNSLVVDGKDKGKFIVKINISVPVEGKEKYNEGRNKENGISLSEVQGLVTLTADQANIAKK